MEPDSGQTDSSLSERVHILLYERLRAPTVTSDQDKRYVGVATPEMNMANPSSLDSRDNGRMSKVL